MRSSARLGQAGFAALLLVAAGAAAYWLWQPAPAPAPATALLPEPVALAPHVFLLGRTEPAAAYVVDTAAGLVLIDSGVEASAAPILEQLAALDLDVKRVHAILLTHVHADHSLGAQHLRALTGAGIYAGRADSAPLREGRPREAFFSTFDVPQFSPHATRVDVELAGEEVLEFGEAHFTVLATPGHTPGSVCYLLERPGLRALFTGDVVQHLNQDGPDALGTYAAYLPPLYGGNVRAYLATLRRLRQLPLPDFVLPGHPRMDPFPENPRLNVERWNSLLTQGITEMEQLLAHYEADGAGFLDGQPKELLPGLRYLGDFGGQAVYCLGTSAGRFLFDAPGGPELVDFLTTRFKQAGWQDRRLTAVILTSADESATAGLPALTKATGCQVVAPKAGQEIIRPLCAAGTKLLSEEDLEKSGWFDVQALELAGRGTAPVAYLVHWHDKAILIPGKIPVKFTRQTIEHLLREVSPPGGTIMPYLSSINRLTKVKPNLWLPAIPVHGQNANLYDNDWNKVLMQNMQLFP